jgi:serine/threonine protein phosphatase PrpC
MSDGVTDTATVGELEREARKLLALGASLQQIVDAFADKAASYPESDNVTVMVVAI